MQQGRQHNKKYLAAFCRWRGSGHTSSLASISCQGATTSVVYAVEMLGTVADNGEKSGYLADWWLATTCVVGYAAYLRIDELVVHIRAVDIKFSAISSCLSTSQGARQISFVSSHCINWDHLTVQTMGLIHIKC